MALLTRAEYRPWLLDWLLKQFNSLLRFIGYRDRNRETQKLSGHPYREPLSLPGHQDPQAQTTKHADVGIESRERWLKHWVDTGFVDFAEREAKLIGRSLTYWERRNAQHNQCLRNSKD